MKDQSSQGKTPGSPYLKKSHRKIKTTSTMFFDWEGIVHHQYTPPGCTMNKKYYFSVLHWLRDAIDETATVMGNWWLAASSWQCTHSFIMSHAEFFGKTSNHLGNSVPLQPRCGAIWILGFSKTKITFERKEISDHQWDSGKYDEAGSSNKGFCRVFSIVEEMLGKLCDVPRHLFWRGLRCHCPMYNVSCILHLLQ